MKKCCPSNLRYTAAAHTHIARTHAPLCCREDHCGEASVLLFCCIRFMLIIGLSSIHAGSAVLDALTSGSRSHPAMKGAHLSASCSQSRSLCHRALWVSVLLWTSLIALFSSWETLQGCLEAWKMAKKLRLSALCVFLQKRNSACWRDLLWVSCGCGTCLREAMCEMKIVQ